MIGFKECDGHEITHVHKVTFLCSGDNLLRWLQSAPDTRLRTGIPPTRTIFKFLVMNQFRTGGPQRELFAVAEDLADDFNHNNAVISLLSSLQHKCVSLIRDGVIALQLRFTPEMKRILKIFSKT
ncbi:hypothetical protein Y032_0100g3251 [Ancylostoma ceylanicum]|uniref:Uncharacterized protein n=1 Tax=Ancylostoma ceylanicum TaxID=53326 RepID=A0A016TH92_9BILA|nr:hypothetical protein Y032_0100g3251 [Ancylostoma ceylanicum]